MQKIMIVEDDSKIAEQLKIHIEKYGYDVTCVIDFEHVMNAFYDINPDLVLLDINLPSFDGYYWCRQIRKESTLYDDYAINERLFHWQTQSRVAEGSKIAERYIHHKKRNHQIALFVREY
ncbi:uncharacterized protein DUF3427 [Neobacillus bataviensis]|uniref:Uncharacterized protein DUF3427 n=1 Tax=Neobacillus bataviensis TaxID=220685 RepID=A0A561DP58_9BACI|nr:uncharacterized protein DUF3427 [Neobacillus bataviensis]